MPFRRRLFPRATAAEWRDWRWQMRHSFRTLTDLGRVFHLSAEERAGFAPGCQRLPVRVTPYYASLMDLEDAQDPLRRTLLPLPAEAATTAADLRDPLGEEPHTPVPGIVHRYPDRALFLLGDRCPVYCRYCTRGRLVGYRATAGAAAPGPRHWQAGLDYLAATPVIRDVLLSGGEPLIFDDDALAWLLTRLRAIPHLELIRIGTKVPMVLPQRVTPALARLLRRFHPLYLSLHVIHPHELTPEAATACARLADAGIPLGGQTVLLKGVNDSVATMKELMQGLLRIRVRPYYLLQMDLMTGTAHFRTPVATGLEMLQGLRGHTSGYAVPHYIVDLPGGGGKVALEPECITGREAGSLVFRNYQGTDGWRYPEG